MSGQKSESRRYRYTLTTHSVHDVMEWMQRAGQSAEGAPVMYCDEEGRCMFDDQYRPYLAGIEGVLNDAAAGKRLVQVIFRQRQMIALWEERIEA
jgi:hypothetical protein